MAEAIWSATVAALLATWLVATVIQQFSPEWWMRLVPGDGFGLLPHWSFFAPNPARQDTHVLYRDLQAGTWRDWHVLTSAPSARTWRWLWNPARLPVKAAIDLANGLRRAAERLQGEPAALMLSSSYLSYATAGIAKLSSPIWRRGNALQGILNTETYGHPIASALAHRSPAIAAALGWSVIVFECAFPLLLVSPHWFAIGLLAVGLSFHVGCAAVMGLNTFLWAFPATYPCALVLSLRVSPWG